MSWIVSFNHQWMAAGTSGRHGNHAVWHVGRDTGYVLAHALIQRQNGTERIALGLISTQRAAMFTSVKVAWCPFMAVFSSKWQNDSTFFDALVYPLLFFAELSYFLTFRMFCNCSNVIAWAPLSFSHDGKIKHSREEVHEFNAARLTGSWRTSRGILTKNNQLFTLLIYRVTYLLNFYLVFSTQIQWYCIRMNQSVVSKIKAIHALYQNESKSTQSTRLFWPIQSKP